MKSATRELLERPSLGGIDVESEVTESLRGSSMGIACFLSHALIITNLFKVCPTATRIESSFGIEGADRWPGYLELTIDRRDGIYEIRAVSKSAQKQSNGRPDYSKEMVPSVTVGIALAHDGVLIRATTERTGSEVENVTTDSSANQKAIDMCKINQLPQIADNVLNGKTPHVTFHFSEISSS